MRRRWSGRIARLALFVVLGACPAAAFELRSPVSCDLDVECFVLQHADRDPGPGAKDHRCGPLAYDGHNGVDFALPSLRAMEAGHRVIAAAPGVVEAVRDDMPDLPFNDPSAPSVEGKECGNGVLIRHDDGWSTQYCHLKQGSLRISRGAQIAAGQPLGLIGLSGQSEFPHLHLTVRRDGEAIDPFDARPLDAPCDSAASGDVLWAPESDVRYVEGGVLSAGLLDRLPDYAEVNATVPRLDALHPDAPAIVHWAHFFGLRKDDVVESRLMGPDGVLLAEESYRMPKTRIRQFRAIGLRRPSEGWAPGLYLGRSQLIRGGAVVTEIATTARLP